MLKDVYAFHIVITTYKKVEHKKVQRHCELLTKCNDIVNFSRSAAT